MIFYLLWLQQAVVIMAILDAMCLKVPLVIGKILMSKSCDRQVIFYSFR